MRDRRARLVALAALLGVSNGARLLAQTTLNQTEDATTPKRGVLRVNAISSWQRYDSRFSPGGTGPLGARFTADSFGVAQLPELAPVENLVQSASGSPFRLNFGRSQLNATTRVNILPIGLEYGITNRLSVGVTIPVVRQRVTTQFVVYPFRLRVESCFNQVAPGTNPCIEAANVGPNPNRTSATAAAQNELLQSQFTSAVTLLDQRLQDCQANPAGSGCAALLQRQTEAEQLLQTSQSFATDIATLYGAGAGNGLAFVPATTSDAQMAIALRVADFNARFRDLLGSSSDVITAIPAGAGPAGAADIQRFLGAELGRDSLISREWIGYGDLEIGAKLRVIERLRDSTHKNGIQFALASGVRLPTGSVRARSEIADMRLGAGRTIVDTRGILDSRFGPVGLLAAAHVGVAVSTKDSTRAMPDSRVVELDISPRWHLSEPLSVHASYSMRSFDSTGTDQLIGGGVSFLSPSAYRRDAPGTPLEMRFTHLEAISGDAGRPKLSIFQLELRLYYRLFGP